jgi:hypothetical protein
MSDLTATAPVSLGAIAADPRPLTRLLTAEFPDSTFIGAFLTQQVVQLGISDPLAVQQHFTISPTASLDVPPIATDPLPGVAWRWQLTLSAYTERSLTTPVPLKVTLGLGIQGPAEDHAWMSSTAISPVRNIGVRTFDGQRQSEGVLESLTPVVVWDAPAVGLPNAYTVDIARVEVVDGVGKRVPLDAALSVQAPEGHVPPGVLTSGERYLFTVTAENCTASDPQRPRRINPQPTCGFVQTSSAVFTAP